MKRRGSRLFTFSNPSPGGWVGFHNDTTILSITLRRRGQRRVAQLVWLNESRSALASGSNRRNRKKKHPEKVSLRNRRWTTIPCERRSQYKKTNAKDTGAGSQTNNSWNFIYGLNGWRAQESGHKKSVIGVNGGLRVTFLDHVGKKCTTLDYKTTTEKTTNGKTLTCKSSILSVIHEFCCMRK